MELDHGGEVSQAQIIAALSRALDMVEGQPKGHAERTAYLSVEIARLVGVDDQLIEDAYFASLLKDSGCSNNAARVFNIFGGDDLLAKREMKLINWSSKLDSVKYAYTYMAPGGSVTQKLRRMVGMLTSPENSMDGLTKARCTRGAAIAAKLGFSPEVASAIQSLDEHWDGNGSPQHLKGTATPVASRIVGLAQTMEVFASTFGPNEAAEMVKSRRGTWFEPALADAAVSLKFRNDVWSAHRMHLEDHQDVLPSPAGISSLPATNIDAICEAFADIIDAKSSFTGEHSTRVTRYSAELGQAFGFDADRLVTLRRAALLHDIGKLGVSNKILDKPGPLTDEEFIVMKNHPRWTYEVLARIPTFGRINEVASAHHEKLNGRGYHRGLGSEALDLDMRIVAVADVFDALTAARPYRDALPLSEAHAIMDRDAGQGLDGECVGALFELKGCPSNLEVRPLAA